MLRRSRRPDCALSNVPEVRRLLSVPEGTLASTSVSGAGFRGSKSDARIATFLTEFRATREVM